MSQRISLIVIGVLCVACCYFFYSYMRIKAQNIDIMLTEEHNGKTAQAAERTAEPEPAVIEEEFVTFYICGEVNNPDIYTLPKGSRINDAILLAGGGTDEASYELMESIAKEITDGQKIYVPNIADDIDKINYMNNNNSAAYDTNKKDPDAIVNINTADVNELCKIPGIGETTAKLIVDYRNENGEFTFIEEIKNVTRIGDKTFESIKNNITVGEAAGGGTP